ncbi:MAG: Fe-S-containing hydro-lyase [Fusobacteriaceae bacterium]|nr:Fe-S-containing hydro-lyase [Fusobacteriaceae bacterium]MBN2838298.1 Fe-S-containing hydro-lyase [Fusobacteriaceae bacterium]
MAEYKIMTPLTEEKIKNLKAGDTVKLSGYIYTARDAAHGRLIDLIKAKKELPFEVEGAVIYYVGPSPTKENEIIGSAGPTTSYRMDAYSPSLLELGLKGMIGKGQRNLEVRESIVKNKAIYFGATGGAAALIAKSVKKNELIAYEDLGAEAIRKLYVEDFPLTVINDIYGNDLYNIGKEKYRIVED